LAEAAGIAGTGGCGLGALTTGDAATEATGAGETGAAMGGVL